MQAAINRQRIAAVTCYIPSARYSAPAALFGGQFFIQHQLPAPDINLLAGSAVAS